MGAVNQALGRVIRHKSDYGAMYLIDVRYSQQEQVRAIEGEAVEVTGAGAKDTEAIEESNVFYKETPFNEFTERLSNWIHERITGDVLLDYGTVNLM